MRDHRTFRIGAALSLTGRFSRFGTQAATGLRVWRACGGDAEPDVLDDGSDPARVGPALDVLADRCDLLLGPYGTSTARAAARWARDRDRLVWNHGGAGRDLQALVPGRFVSVITPTDRYGEPFVRHLARRRPGSSLTLVAGPGSFGSQVVAGTRRAADEFGVPIVDDNGSALFSAGTFEHDTELVAALLTEDDRPEPIGTVAAGVAAFADAVPNPDGVLGVAQWFRGSGIDAEIGPDEDAFRSGYRQETGAEPDYPAVQAAAAAAIAVHCAHAAEGTGPDELWTIARDLRTSTLYGDFAVDPTTGAQVAHQVALVRWEDGQLVREDGG